MRSPVRLLVLLVGAAFLSRGADLPFYSVAGAEPGAWPEILSSIGLERRPSNEARVVIVREGASLPATGLTPEAGVLLVLEGESPAAAQFGFRPGKARARVSSVIDTHRPELPIVWEKEVDLPVFSIPSGAQVFAKERWSGTPLIAGMRRGSGAVLWVAVSPGERGYERFPYLLAAMSDLGMDPPFRSARLWAFFDSSYRLRVDLDYFAKRWREAGISALHVAAWHYYEADPSRDAYLAKLIEACHREGIQVYAWLELPHVSDRFWEEHPEWREKTAVLQDAQLDWRKLMNLANHDCLQAVKAGVKQLAGRFNWDGLNLAELYFESLEGVSNPSRFTPMNKDVREEFQHGYGFDPIEIFGSRKDAASRQAFLDFRASLARRIQEQWLGELESLREQKPYLDLVLTHVDDRFDTETRNAIGADAARVLPLLDKHRFTFLIEDPATIWHLGPQRYHAIAERYRALTPRSDELAIDLNIVDRYQNVYPTKQQTGTELLQLVHNAAANFHRVALYFESSLTGPDLKLLPAASAAATRAAQNGSKTTIGSLAGVGVPWKGPALVDGQLWPVADNDTVWLPAGPHTVEPSELASGARLVRLTGDLLSARTVSSETIEFTYQSGARAIAVFDRRPKRLQVDGAEQNPERAGPFTMLLPPGRHVVNVTVE
jgi:hypothetical protein